MAKIRVLYLDQSVGWRHAPVTRPKNSNGPTQSEVALAEIGATSGAFTVESTQDARTITPEKLKDIDVLAFYTTGELPISAEAWAAIQKWVESGKGGFVGLHSATDTHWDYTGPGQTYTAFINGKFAGHPWTQGTPITVQALGQKAGGGNDPVNTDLAGPVHLCRGDLSVLGLRPGQGPRAASAGLRRHGPEASVVRADHLDPPDRPGPAVQHQPRPYAQHLGRSALPRPDPRRRALDGPSGAGRGQAQSRRAGAMGSARAAGL
jgi:hypothetical protein